jgi:predicted molibdopterin-dependent oxidoreductase YjgC
VAPGVVYTTFHHPLTQANVVTTEYSDWATNCPEYKMTAVQSQALERPHGMAVELSAADGEDATRRATGGGGGVSEPPRPVQRALRTRGASTATP